MSGQKNLIIDLDFFEFGCFQNQLLQRNGPVVNLKTRLGPTTQFRFTNQKIHCN